jgi:hypothetical protein
MHGRGEQMCSYCGFRIIFHIHSFSPDNGNISFAENIPRGLHWVDPQFPREILIHYKINAVYTYTYLILGTRVQIPDKTNKKFS